MMGFESVVEEAAIERETAVNVLLMQSRRSPNKTTKPVGVCQ